MKRLLSLTLSLVLLLSFVVPFSVSAEDAASFVSPVLDKTDGVTLLSVEALDNTVDPNGIVLYNVTVETFDISSLVEKTKRYDYAIEAIRAAFAEDGYGESDAEDENGDKEYYFLGNSDVFRLYGKTVTEEELGENVICFYHVTADDTPSEWAQAEVEKAISLGLIPEANQMNYKVGIYREELAAMLRPLLEKCYSGKTPATETSPFRDTDSEDVLYLYSLGILNGYEQKDGTFLFCPEKELKRSEMAVILSRIAKLCGKTTDGYDESVTFIDTVSHWCRKELGYPVAMGIIKGTSATTFSPEKVLTTEQTILLVLRTYEALTAK